MALPKAGEKIRSVVKWIGQRLEGFFKPRSAAIIIAETSALDKDKSAIAEPPALLDDSQEDLEIDEQQIERPASLTRTGRNMLPLQPDNRGAV
ncbi:MAG: hypothetical protein LBT44_05575, partial [Clostridiales bacterium]|nr:hypothetical protein [Clostridiales bacterium]